MQMSQDRLKSRLKDFHLRFKFVDNRADYKVLFTSITRRPYITGLLNLVWVSIGRARSCDF